MALAASFAWLAAFTIQAASFTATLDRDVIAAGETVTLTLKFEGGQPKSMPTLPAIPHLQIGSQGSSRNFSIINGQMSSSLSETFALTPMRPGDYTIPALKAEVDGKILTSQPLQLKALKPDSSVADDSGDRLAFLKLVVPKKELYVGEVMKVELHLFVRDGVANAENILRNFEGLGGAPLKADGFSALKTARAQPRRVQIGNGIYTVATLVTALVPVKTGPLTIDSINATLTLQLPTANRRRDVFDPFGMFQQVEERQVSIAAETETVTALPLPNENVPANFNGAVGSYAMTVTAAPTNVAAGDPITVRIHLSGNGALDALALPDQPAWPDFKLYTPAAKPVDTSDPLGIRGTKTFEEVVVPQKADINELPPISFSYFDSDKRSYQTLTGPAIAVVVRPGGSTAVPVIAAANRAAQDNPPPSQDIVYIMQRLGTVAQIGPPLVQQPWFLALQGVPVLALLGSVIWRKRSEMLARNPRLRRQRRVARIIRDGLGQLRRFAAEKNSEGFFAALFRLLQEQLGERLDLPASAITEAVIEEHLRPRGVAEATLAGLHELFQTCNLARYAPIKTSQELAAIIPKLETALRELRELKL